MASKYPSTDLSLHNKPVRNFETLSRIYVESKEKNSFSSGNKPEGRVLYENSQPKDKVKQTLEKFVILDLNKQSFLCGNWDRKR